MTYKDKASYDSRPPCKLRKSRVMCLQHPREGGQTCNVWLTLKGANLARSAYQSRISRVMVAGHFSQIEPLIVGLFCRKWPMKIRDPTNLANLVSHVTRMRVRHVWHDSLSCVWHDSLACVRHDSLKSVLIVRKNCDYRMAKTHRMHYLYGSFYAKEPYD